MWTWWSVIVTLWMQSCSFFFSLFIPFYSRHPLCSRWQGGMYLLQLLDHHVCSGTTLLLLSLCQSISIGWVYGKTHTTDRPECGGVSAVLTLHLSFAWRFRPLLQQHRRHDWLSTVPVDEVLLDLHHPLHLLCKASFLSCTLVFKDLLPACEPFLTLFSSPLKLSND